MAYTYQTGTANHVIHWFALLETFLVGVGWTVESGTGTTTVVFSSPGELGGRTKLFIRFRQDGAALERVWFRVQDDAVGTHFTTETVTYISYLEAPGGGLVPYVYFMAADKDKVIVNFKAGVGYTGAYVGLVEPFSLSVDEEEQMVAFGLGRMDQIRCGYILKDDAGNWDEALRAASLSTTYIQDPLDSSYAVFAVRLDELGNNKIIGQPTDIGGRLNTTPGLNPEDIITTGYTGATSTWLVMGTGTMRWTFRTGGNVPVGNLEGAYFAHANGVATSQADLESKLLAFLTSVGWSKVANPTPVWPIDHFWNSAGESGIDNIYIHYRYEVTQKRYEIRATDDTTPTHGTAYQLLNAEPSDFPTYYYLTADRDCFLMVLEIAGVYSFFWGGMFQMFMPDPDSYATPYKVGVVGAATPVILRAHNGSWGLSLGEMTDAWNASSPNLYDGVTNVVWQYPLLRLSTPIGIAKYLHRLSGPAFSVMDTVAIGARSFRYFQANLAFREV